METDGNFSVHSESLCFKKRVGFFCIKGYGKDDRRIGVIHLISSHYL